MVNTTTTMRKLRRLCEEKNIELVRIYWGERNVTFVYKVDGSQEEYGYNDFTDGIQKEIERLST